MDRLEEIEKLLDVYNIPSRHEWVNEFRWAVMEIKRLRADRNKLARMWDDAQREIEGMRSQGGM